MQRVVEALALPVRRNILAFTARAGLSLGDIAARFCLVGRPIERESKALARASRREP